MLKEFMKRLYGNETFAPHTERYIKALESVCCATKITNIESFVSMIYRLCDQKRNRVGCCEIDEEGKISVKPIECLYAEKVNQDEYRIFEYMLWALCVMFFSEYDVCVCITPQRKDNGMDIVVLKQDEDGYQIVLSLDGKTGDSANSMINYNSILRIVRKVPTADTYRHLYVARDVKDFGAQMRKQQIMTSISLYNLVKTLVRTYADTHYRLDFEHKLYLKISTLKAEIL